MKHLKLFENFNEEITFEILGYNVNYAINENFDLNYYKYKEKDEETNRYENITIPLTTQNKNKLRKFKKNISNYLHTINPFEGRYINKQGHIIKRNFEIKYGDHWLNRFLRKDIEDPTGIKKIEEPGELEGVNLIYDNKDKITEYVDTKIIQDDFRVLVKMKTDTYELIFDIEKDRLIKKKYRIYFVTQMKGIGHNFKDYNPSKKPINRTIYLA